MARYKTAVFSTSTNNFQKLFFTNEGWGSSEFLCQKIFQSASIICYFCCKSYRFEKEIYRKQYDINNGRLTTICLKKTAKNKKNIIDSTILKHYLISNIRILQSYLGKTLIFAKTHSKAHIYLITQK